MISSDDLAQRLKAARTDADLTQAELAQRAGLSLYTLAKLEQGKVSQPSFFTILALVEQLNLSLDTLCGLSDKPPTNALNDDWQHISWCFVDPAVLFSGWLDSIGQLAEQINVDSIKLETLFLKHRNQLLLGQTSIYEFEQIIGRQFEVPPRKISLREVWFETLQIPQQLLKLLRQLYAQEVKIGIIGAVSKQLLVDFANHGNLPKFLSDQNRWVLGASTADNLEVAERTADQLPKQLLLVTDSPQLADAAASRNWQTNLISASTTLA